MNEFPAKSLKKLPTGFTDSVDSMKTDEIQQKVLEAEGHIYEVEKAKEADEKLAQARELVKELAAPYKETAACEAAKIKYCIYVLESRGVSVSSKASP